MTKYILTFLTFSLLSSHLFAQKISETGFDASVDLISIPKMQSYWNLNEFTPTFLSVGVTKSWYKQSHFLSLRKEFGLNIRHGDIDFSGGGLGAQAGYDGDIYSFMVSPAVVAHFQFSQRFSVDFGPGVEFPLFSINDMVYWMRSRDIYNTFNKKVKGINRDYFNDPSFGVKGRITVTSPDDNVTFGFTFAYMLTEESQSSFYIKDYTKLGICLGLKK